jgi:hypothetical protein
VEHKEMHIHENFGNYDVLETVALKFMLTLPTKIWVISPTRVIRL